jgi:aspartyl/asparaginyl-tRNA synthetase
LQPSHRGESPDKTHLSQFYHAEAEIHGSFDDAISLAERYIRALATELLAKHRAQIEAIAGDTRHIGKLITSSTPFHRISVTEAQKILASSEVAVHSDPQFRVISRKGERELIERFGGFVWLTELDHLSAPFYQAFNDSAHTSAKAADLLFGLGEVIGMGERHRTAADVRAALALHDVSEKGYEWYLRLREEYPLTTSGFGLGVERFLCWLLKHDDIRDCQLIPRVNGEVSVL